MVALWGLARAMTRAINPAGLKIIESSEELRLEAYRHKNDKWTIGYGHTGPDVHPGLVITEGHATTLLQRDVAQAERLVTHVVQVDLTDNQFGALVSLVYNIGIGRFQTSTMLRMLNNGDYERAAGQFRRWVTEAGEVLPGLVTRRRAERELFML